MAKARGLALAALLLLTGCGGSSEPAPSRVVLHVAAPLVPQEVDPAQATDLPSLNVAHELYAGLTRFSGTGVEPDLAESWDVEQDGLVWIFHLRKHLEWSDDTPIVAADFRRSWLRALAPGIFLVPRTAVGTDEFHRVLLRIAVQCSPARAAHTYCDNITPFHRV